MAFSKGKFGVLYHPREGEESHFLRWIVGVVLLVLVAFVCYKVSKSFGGGSAPDEEPMPAESGTRAAEATPPAPPAVPEKPVPPARNAGRKGDGKSARPAPDRKPAADTPPATAPRSVPPPPPAPRAKPKAGPSPEAQALIDKILETIASRPAAEKVWLEKLVAAEQQGNAAIAADAIKKLCTRPQVADLKDLLMRRLGDLNLRQLFSGKNTPWTKLVTVRRGDGRERIAREHRTTSAAVVRLNPDVKWEKLKPGDTVRVLDFPNATLVIYLTGYADLSLIKNERFFRRYYLSVPKSAKSGVYPVESGNSATARFRELGAKLTPADRAELEMFLAPGSRIIVSSE